MNNSNNKKGKGIPSRSDELIESGARLVHGAHLQPSDLIFLFGGALYASFEQFKTKEELHEVKTVILDAITNIVNKTVETLEEKITKKNKGKPVKNDGDE